MNKNTRLTMALHGIGSMLLGLLAGIPYALVLTHQLAGEERAWRMAHAEGIQNGLLLLALAGIAGEITIDERRATLCAGCLASDTGRLRPRIATARC